MPGPEAPAAQFGMLLTLTGTTLKDVYEARAVIEPAAARRLAERGTAADRNSWPPSWTRCARASTTRSRSAG